MLEGSSVLSTHLRYFWGALSHCAHSFTSPFSLVSLTWLIGLLRTSEPDQKRQGGWDGHVIRLKWCWLARKGIQKMHLGWFLAQPFVDGVCCLRAQFCSPGSASRKSEALLWVQDVHSEVPYHHKPIQSVPKLSRWNLACSVMCINFGYASQGVQWSSHLLLCSFYSSLHILILGRICFICLVGNLAVLVMWWLTQQFI